MPASGHTRSLAVCVPCPEAKGVLSAGPSVPDRPVCALGVLLFISEKNRRRLDQVGVLLEGCYQSYNDTSKICSGFPRQTFSDPLNPSVGKP